MITPKEIKDHCLKWWKEVLDAAIDNKAVFPREVQRIGKIGPKDILSRLSEHKNGIAILRKESKEFKSFGYRIEFIDRLFEKIGNQQVPNKILIETLHDYLKLISKEKEYEKFRANLVLIQTGLPPLISWVRDNPLKLIDHDSWLDTLKVCRYFLSNPKPNLYLRQLPIDIHTKYILENKSIVQSLLEYLIRDHVNYNETRFEQRFNLKYAEPLIRIRFLDNNINPLKGISDISITLSEFHTFSCKNDNVFITENIMNFLTLPKLPKAIAIWSGGGFNVSYLKDVLWIKAKQLYYWGDLDAQGFQILNQFRQYFPNTIAVMMNEETLQKFKPRGGKPCSNQNLTFLSDKELKLYKLLREKNLRLEQEKLTQTYSEAVIAELINPVNQPFYS
jgi:hypothetical protein